MVYYRAYSKINLGLKIVDRKDGYHMLDTICCTVDKYDELILKKRKDKKIVLNFKGKYGDIDIDVENTNAYKAASMFINKFNTNGVNIDLKRNIPTGSGMGGSSSDISGTLNGLKKLYSIEEDVKDIADSLGSDSGYLLTGGFCRLKGRGDIVEKIDTNINLYFVVIYGKKGVETKESFKLYDNEGEREEIINMDELEEGLKRGELIDLNGKCTNSLLYPSSTLNEEIKDNLKMLENLSPYYYGMSGSGSTVFAAYTELEMAKWAYEKIKRKTGNSELLSSYAPEGNTSLFFKLFGHAEKEFD